MKRLSTFLLFVALLASCTSGEQDEELLNNQNGVNSSKDGYNYPGLYVTETNGTYVFLHPDGTGSCHYSHESKKIYWSSKISSSAIVYVENRGDSVVIDGRVYSKICEPNLNSIDSDIIGKWELKKSKIISPVSYDKSFQSVTYKSDAKIEEVSFWESADYKTHNEKYRHAVVVFTDENVVKLSNHGNSAEFTITIGNPATYSEKPYGYSLSYIISDYKTSGNNIINHSNGLYFYYKIEGGSLILDCVVNDEGTLILYSCTYHKLETDK